MKKSELIKLIREEIQLLKEDNELLKAQDALKGVMFKIQKDIEPFFKDLKSKKIINSYKQKIRPLNTGYEIEFNIDTNVYKLEKDEYLKHKDFYNAVTDLHSIYVHPSSFLQSDLEEGKQAYIEGSLFKLKGSSYFREPVKNKQDIKKAANEYYKTIQEQIKSLKRDLKAIK